MFAPTKIWRRWHRRINITEKRYALVSALAATALPALVMARGHRIEGLPEVPLVVDNKVIDNVDKSSKAVALLKSLNAYDDVERVKDTKSIRPGKGKMRNRRCRVRRGPLLVYAQENSPIIKAFRNLPGVDICNVNRLNLLQLAPGGHLGRFIVWTKDAFEKLDSIYGTYSKISQEKKGYHLPRHIMTNPDLTRLTSSEEIQSVIRPKITRQQFRGVKKNPLKNEGMRHKMDPYHRVHVRNQQGIQAKRMKEKAAIIDQKRKGTFKPNTNPKKIHKKKVAKRITKEHKKFYDLLLK